MVLSNTTRTLIKLNLDLIFVMIITSVLRLINLGHSDYQGDEIRALYMPIQGESFVDFLLRQRKGPVQFFVTYLVRFVDPYFHNYYIDRLPFAIASIVAVFFLFKFVELMFGRKTAFFTSLLVSINGFFVGLSRILQYQGFVFLFSFAALYYFARFYKNGQLKHLYLAAFMWGLSMLAHYDGIFIAPFVVYLLFRWFISNPASSKYKCKHFVLAFCAPVVMQIIFYMSLFLSLSAETTAYWTGRLTGTVSSKSASSVYLFRVYQPFYVLEFYLVFLVFAVFETAWSTLCKLPLKWPLLYRFQKRFCNFTPPGEYLDLLAVFAWALFPIVFMEVLVKIPGTHIYTYLLPICLLIGFSLAFLYHIYVNHLLVKSLYWIFIGLFFVFAFLQSYAIYVDNHKEYPWENEKFLVWEFSMPDISKYHLSLFGFPYYRNWLAISNFVKSYPQIKAYTSNENNAISNYYLLMEKSTDKAGFYVYIRNPQSFKNTTNNEKYLYWASKNNPVFTLSRYGSSIANVYIMPTGTYQELINLGY